MDNPNKHAAFACQRCGDCCQGEGGIVLTEADVDRLCGHLGMEPSAFAAAYVETIGGKSRLRTSASGWCIFFTEGCSVHPAKPAICRAWPFFRGNMVDATSWQMAQDSCPGINPEPGHLAFITQGERYLQSLEVEPNSDAGPNALRREKDT
ncbi:YkgJ family cysteine cluster protein [Desulfonatronum thioautotrophicum]|uniref:YkgJ family cysteine cluster protein n=1 Tax=Desulfonatronum thioautotrophicum TaxID=617001 RepID=UPI0005EB5AAA|nr:YkgJ family cysteine cluster protein [Desulfonatronum thioautotrophicum]